MKSKFDFVVDKWNELKIKYHLEDWYLNFPITRSYFGRCWYNKNRIDISLYHLEINEEPLILKTLLHEIAHALTKNGHSIEWKNKFQALLNLEMDGEIVSRYGKGKMVSAVEAKNKNKFELKI